MFSIANLIVLSVIFFRQMTGERYLVRHLVYLFDH